jgi:hypothetical protein
MLPQKYRYFFKRAWHLGPYKILWLSAHKLKKRLFIHRHKKRIAHGKNYHTWQEISYTHDLQDFDSFFNQLKAKDFCEKIFIQLPTQTPVNIIKKADKAATPTVTILGFGEFSFSLTNIPWHQDFTQTKQSPAAWQDTFYADIIPKSCSKYSNECPFPEIKVPWELSRLQHLFSLGIGYRHAQRANDHERATHYAHAFQEQISSWMKNNPFARGVNWLNPMEVAIRGINLVWAFHFFKNEPHISLSWWQEYVCMLYDHAIYLESNWEVSDKPNNHYISDLVGYLYLSSLLVDIKKIYQTQKQVITNLTTQFKHQTLIDGTCYEGSTNYHVLVTELLGHTLLVCASTNIHMPLSMHTLYHKMLSFLADCTDQSGMLVQIGDNDSGHILANRPWQATGHYNNSVKTYQHFGLTIIFHDGFFITFRHPTYQNKQPSGHFHHDQLAITLSIDGIPVLIDPGTYRYTSHPAIRNHLRSFAAHNTFHLSQSAQNDLPANLFQLNRTPHTPHAKYQNQMIHDTHQHYQANNLVAHRHIAWNNERFHIIDWWEQTTKITKKQESIWTLHFGPDIELEKKDNHHWIVKKETKEICCVETTLIFDYKDDIFSPLYGAKISTKILVASTQIDCNKQHIVIQRTLKN